MWATLSRLGFSGGDVLEPASGIGAFLEDMPEHIYNNSKSKVDLTIYEKLYILSRIVPFLRLFRNHFD